MIDTMTLAIGLALRDTLSNVAPGIMILMLRPFRTGQFVEIAGVTGTIEAISIAQY